MKNALIIFALLAATGTANAQEMANVQAAKTDNDNSYHKTTSTQGNEFAATEMSLNEGKVSFSGLPELTKSTWAIITSSTGDIVKQKKISPENNTIDIHDLHGGRLYFVSITYKDKTKKAFTLNL